MVKDSNGNDKIIDRWISKENETHDFGNKLNAGNSYILRETVAPTGYSKITTDMKFKVNTDGSIELSSNDIKESQDANGDKLYLIEDTAIVFNVNKVDAGNGEEVAGATLVVYEIDGTTGDTIREVDSWKSKVGEIHNFGDKLEVGKTYILRETIAPDDYTKIDTDIRIVVAEDGSITTELENTTDSNENKVYLVKDAKKGAIVFTKKGRFNEEFASNANETEAISGVEFTISNINTPSNVIATATSQADGTVTFNRLNPGRYLIKEINAGHENYMLDDTEYYAEITINGFTGLEYADGSKVENNTIINEVYRGSIKFTKVNELHTDQTLKGSTYGLYRKVSSYAKKENETSDISASTGNQEGISGTLPADAEIEEIDGVEYAKLAEATSDENGVVEFNGTITGVEYIVKELVAPKGYYVSSDKITLKLSVDSNGETTMAIINDGDGTITLDENGNITWLEPVVVIKVKKVNQDGELLAGAILCIEDENEDVIVSWTTTDEEYVIEGILESGKTYKLVENKAPDGYKLADSKDFTIDENSEEVINIEMVDEKEEVKDDEEDKTSEEEDNTTDEAKEEVNENTSETSSKSVKTGDSIIYTLVMLAIASIGLVYAAGKREI